MFITYSQKQSFAQQKEGSTVSSVFDSSSQSESLQRKANMANNATQRAETPRLNNTGMPDNLKSGIESLSGFSMDDVRVHYNSSKPATVQALAYTQGTDIHVAPGQERHLPHEAWHVAQQMAGRVSPTTNINGMPVNDNAALEHEADVMGEKAVGQMFSINKKTDFSSTKKYTIQNHSIRQTNSNTKQNVTQCVHIKVHDNIVLPDQSQLRRSHSVGTRPVFNNANSTPPTAYTVSSIESGSITSRSRSFSAPPVFNNANSTLPTDSIDSSIESDSVPSRSRSFRAPPVFNNTAALFTNKMIQALKKIEHEYYVQKILQFPCNTGITIVQTFNDSVGSAWENGKIRGTDYELAMHLGQCDNMFWGTPEAYEKAEKKQGNVPIHVTLLHELGHAYQYYLTHEMHIQNFSDSNFSGLMYKTKERLKKYPLFFKAILDKDSEHLSSVLKHYEIKEPGQTADKLINYDNSTIIDILNKIEKIAQLGYDPDADSDNMFMNEIPYVKAQNEKGENFPVRGHYSHSYTPTMFDMSIWKFQFFLEENDLIKTDKQKINDKMDAIDAFFKTPCVDSDLLKKTKNEQWSKSFWENYIYIKYIEKLLAPNIPYDSKLKNLKDFSTNNPGIDTDFLMETIQLMNPSFYKKIGDELFKLERSLNQEFDLFFKSLEETENQIDGSVRKNNANFSSLDRNSQIALLTNELKKYYKESDSQIIATHMFNHDINTIIPIFLEKKGTDINQLLNPICQKYGVSFIKSRMRGNAKTILEFYKFHSET